MKLDDFDYALPAELIAQQPACPRDSSRLLVYDRISDAISQAKFSDILGYLRAGDVVVINNTKVMRSRLFGRKETGGGQENGNKESGAGSAKFEILLHKKIDGDGVTYEVLLKPAKRLHVGDKVIIGGAVTGELVSKNEQDGTAVMRFDNDPQEYGALPIPPYITEKQSDENRYQTVYADRMGSAAAPTAGLHWTGELMDAAKAKGVIFCEILLHVGLGTFRPVKCEEITEHKMHSEYYQVTAEAADVINAAKKDGRRVIATGTTSVRTLESVFARFGEMRACTGDTEIFIYPPYKFLCVDAIITNFHLPKSTLLMLVSAFIGREKALELYDFAIKEKFRFFSFGDACFFM